jgi:hypothetical protein
VRDSPTAALCKSTVHNHVAASHVYTLTARVRMHTTVADPADPHGTQLTSQQRARALLVMFEGTPLTFFQVRFAITACCTTGETNKGSTRCATTATPVTQYPNPA